jgi:hypothetical protein
MAIKKLKHPKRPKQSSPLSTWERYDARCKEVDKINATKAAEAKKKEALIKKTRK